MKYQETIGIVGGMGSYATLDLFGRLLKAFPAEKEWDRPRIIIDNRCTMPSRVRAILYQEERPALVSELATAAQGLMNCGANKLVFACNTSHVFLDEVFALVPEAKGKTIHLIDILAKRMSTANVRCAYLMASEGTIESGIYQASFSKYDIKLTVPGTNDYEKLRTQIEAVKQNRVDTNSIGMFSDFCETVPLRHIILGCTELPILSKEYRGQKLLWDPIEAVIQHLCKTLQ